MYENTFEMDIIKAEHCLYDAGLGTLRGKRALVVKLLAQKFVKSRHRRGVAAWEGSARLLAEDAKVSESTARNSIDYLTSHGFLSWEQGLLAFQNGAISGQRHSYYYPTKRMGRLMDQVDPVLAAECAERDCLNAAPVEIIQMGPELLAEDLFSYWDDLEPIESEPIESEPIESEPIESEPIESERIESERIESEPIESERIEVKNTRKPALSKTAETIGPQKKAETCKESIYNDLYPTPTKSNLTNDTHVGNTITGNGAHRDDLTVNPAPLGEAGPAITGERTEFDMKTNPKDAFPSRRNMSKRQITQKQRHLDDRLDLWDEDIVAANLPKAANTDEARELVLSGLKALITSLAVRQKDTAILEIYDFDSLANAPISTLAKAVFNPAWHVIGAKKITSGAFAKAVQKAGHIATLALLDTTLKTISRSEIPIKNPFGYWQSTVRNALAHPDPVAGLSRTITTHGAVIEAELAEFNNKPPHLKALDWINNQPDKSPEEILETHRQKILETRRKTGQNRHNQKNYPENMPYIEQVKRAYAHRNAF